MGDSDTLTRPDWGVMGDAQPKVGDAVDRAATLAAVRNAILDRAPAERPTLSRHVLLRPLGSGGSGIVYEAFDPELGRKVAVKLLKSSASSDASTREARLRREAQATAKVSHPNVIAIYDVGAYGEQDLRDVVTASTADAPPTALPSEGVFVVMELVDGCDLREWMQQEHPWRTRLAILVQAGRGLAAAHAQSLVHRDFKPDNVFVGTDGGGEGDGRSRVRVLDFGLALGLQSPSGRSDPTPGSDARDSFDGDTDDGWPSGERPQPLSAPERASPQRLTESGVVVGTPAYMSPEQHLGNPADARSDQFNFCATAYEVLAGHRPYARSDMRSLFEAKRVGRIRPVPKSTRVPRRVWAALRRGLSPRPQDRWPSMDALLRELTPRRRRRAIGMGIAGVAVALPVGAGLYGYASSDECERAAAGLDDVWSDPVQEGIEARVRSALGDTGEATWQEARRRIDTYVDGWSERRGEACRARQEADTQAAMEASERRVACLERQRLELRGTLDVLHNEEGRVVHKTLRVLDGLQPLEACDSPDPRAPLLPPPGPERLEALEILSELSRADTLDEVGAHRRRMAVVSNAVERAQKLAHDPTLARAVFADAMAMWDDQDPDTAIERTDHALMLAERSGDEFVSVMSMVARANILGTTKHEFAEAERLLDWVDSRSKDPFVTVRTLRIRGIILRDRGKSAEAVEAFERAIALFESELPEDEVLLASTITQNAGAHAVLGHHDVALAAYERALTLLGDSIGSGPETAFANNNMGYLLRQLGRIDEACARYEAAHEMFSSFYGDVHETVGMTLTNLGGCQSMLGQAEAALATQREGLRVKEAALGPDHPDCAYSWVNLGDGLVVLDRFEEAREAHERAIEIWRAVDPSYHLMAYSHAGLADAALGLGEVETARTHVRRALELHPADQDRDFAVRIEFAQARIRAHENPVEARRMVATLRHDVALRNDPTLGDAVERWWAEHAALEME